MVVRFVGKVRGMQQLIIPKGVTDLVRQGFASAGVKTGGDRG